MDTNLLLAGITQAFDIAIAAKVEAATAPLRARIVELENAIDRVAVLAAPTQPDVDLGELARKLAGYVDPSEVAQHVDLSEVADYLSSSDIAEHIDVVDAVTEAVREVLSEGVKIKSI
jgi:hypothetical protein